MAVVECAKHGVLQAYEPVMEREDAVVVQCKIEVCFRSKSLKL